MSQETFLPSTLVLHTAATHEYSHIINLNSDLWERHMKNLPGEVFFFFLTLMHPISSGPLVAHCHPLLLLPVFAYQLWGQCSVSSSVA